VVDARECSCHPRPELDAARETNVAQQVHVRALDIDAFTLRSVPLVMGGGGQRDARDHTDQQDEQQQMVCAT
jgi:hypothetical protein